MSEPAERRFAGIPVGAIIGVLVALAVIGTIVYLLLPQMDALFVDDSIDTAALPNSSRVAAGTPVSVVTGKANPTAVAPASGAVTQASSADSPPSGAVTPASGATAATQAQATPAVRPTQVPVQSSAATSPAASSPAAPASAAPAAVPTPAAPAPTAAMLLDEHFRNNDAGWPSSSLGPATITNGAYKIATRLAGQFVAIGAPIVGLPADLSVSAGFRKLDGPAGGGYGIILRDQGPGPRDGASQEGRYYVLEVGDKGEIGIWRRDADHWVDLLAWQHSDAVKPGVDAPNELTVKAVGSTLSMIVNGTQVASRTDATFSGGQVGLFVGGDGNQVLVDHFLVMTP